MSEPRFVRRAGAGRLADGTRVTWSVAEGRRGRRWREARVGDDGIVSSLLFETGPDDRFSHLELATAAGMLTLHPEGDGTLHGNAICEDGIRHVAGEPFEPADVVLVEGSAIAVAAAGRLLGATIEPGRATDLSLVWIGLDLAVERRAARIERSTAATWSVQGSLSVDLDGDGLPQLRDGDAWPLDA